MKWLYAFNRRALQRRQTVTISLKHGIAMVVFLTALSLSLITSDLFTLIAVEQTPLVILYTGLVAAAVTGFVGLFF